MRNGASDDDHENQNNRKLKRKTSQNLMKKSVSTNFDKRHEEKKNDKNDRFDNHTVQA